MENRHLNEMANMVTSIEKDAAIAAYEKAIESICRKRTIIWNIIGSEEAYNIFTMSTGKKRMRIFRKQEELRLVNEGLRQALMMIWEQHRKERE